VKRAVVKPREVFITPRAIDHLDDIQIYLEEARSGRADKFFAKLDELGENLVAFPVSETTDAMTLYHMDGDVLMATHYCPLCNQPRLNLVHKELGEIGFEFVSATNLPDLESAHQHSFQIHIIDHDSFWRSETYVGSNGFTEGIIYSRA
jgi:hypothetical protein